MTSQRQASVRHEVNETLRAWTGSPPGSAVTERTVPPAGAAAVVNRSAEAQAVAAGPIV